MLTSCGTGSTESTVGGTVSETAAETETSAKTETSAEKASDSGKNAVEKEAEDVKIPMEMKPYDPFPYASYVIDANATDTYADSPFSTGILDFMRELETAQQFMQADYAIHDSEDYTETETILEGDENSAFVYKPLKPEIAKNEEELFNYLRKFFTQNYISDEELREHLFMDEYDNTPRYKTIDGRLCVRCGYHGVMTTIETDKIWVLTISEPGDYLSIAANAYGVDYPPYHAIMNIQRSDEKSWQLDSLDFKMYDQALCDVVFNGLRYKRSMTLDMILSGYIGYGPLENPRTVTVDGEHYTEAETGSIKSMKEFFAEIFAETIYYKDDHGNITGSKNLREDYTKKYIDDVYIERDGVVYRRDSAPVWSLPYNEIDTDKSIGSGSRLGEFDAEITLEDLNYHSERYTISFTSRGEVIDGREVVYEILVSSELPIKEVGKHFREVVKPVMEKKRDELNESDEPFGVTNIYSGTMFDYNNDGHDDYVFGYSLYAQFQLVIIDSQDGSVLLDERIMTHLLPSTDLKIYKNDNSEYMFKISQRLENPVASHITETIHFIKGGESFILEAVYDKETGDFSHAYNMYTKEEYFQKQEELLEGYEHCADIEWSM